MKEWEETTHDAWRKKQEQQERSSYLPTDKQYYSYVKTRDAIRLHFKEIYLIASSWRELRGMKTLPDLCISWPV